MGRCSNSEQITHHWIYFSEWVFYFKLQGNNGFSITNLRRNRKKARISLFRVVHLLDRVFSFNTSNVTTGPGHPGNNKVKLCPHGIYVLKRRLQSRKMRMSFASCLLKLQSNECTFAHLLLREDWEEKHHYCS